MFILDVSQSIFHCCDEGMVSTLASGIYNTYGIEVTVDGFLLIGAGTSILKTASTGIKIDQRNYNLHFVKQFLNIPNRMFCFSPLQILVLSIKCILTTLVSSCLLASTDLQIILVETTTLVPKVTIP